MSLDFEKDFNDEVYEDSFYSEDEEELEEDDELVKDEFEDEDEEDEIEDPVGAVRIDVSFVCDDCDYRWDDTIVQKNNEYNEAEDITDCVCPMCGSMNVAQI